jgi:nitrite reductase/ring-hydroxylating ferredoxin subunit
VAGEHYVADLADFAEGERRVVRVDNVEIGVFNVGGRFYALPNVCIHQRGPLCEGTVTGTLTASRADDWRPRWVREGEILRCPWHRLEFDLATGECLGYPGRRLRTYRVSVADGKVLLSV